MVVRKRIANYICHDLFALINLLEKMRTNERPINRNMVVELKIVQKSEKIAFFRTPEQYGCKALIFPHFYLADS